MTTMDTIKAKQLKNMSAVYYCTIVNKNNKVNWDI